MLRDGQRKITSQTITAGALLKIKTINMETITKLANKNYRIDLTGQQLTFLDSRFYYTEDGQFVPSVTTVLEAYPKGAAFYEWLKKNGEDSDAIRDEAGRKGSLVHGLTELYDQGEVVTLLNDDGGISYKVAEWNMFEKYVDFRNRFAFDIIHSEQTIVSPTLGFAGTLDRVIEMNGKKILVDIKTSGSVWPSYWLQLAAYRKLLFEMYGTETIDEVAILWLNAKTKTEGRKDTIQGKGWQLITRSESETKKDWQLFRATQELWKAENGTAAPRQQSYQLKHQLIS